MLYLWAIGLTLVIYYWLSRGQKSDLDNLPGPKGIPLFGNLFQLDNTGKAHLQMFDWAKKYGDIFRLNLLGESVIVVSGKEALHEINVKKGKEFGGRPSSFRMKEISGNDSDVAFGSLTDNRWKLLKKIIISQTKGYGAGFKIIEKLTLDILNETFDDISFENGEALLALDQTILEILSKVIYTVMFGTKPTKHEVTKMIKMIYISSSIMKAGGNEELLDMFPWLRFFGHSTYKEICEVKKIRKELYVEWKSEMLRKRSAGEDLNSNVIHRVLQIIEGENVENITEDCALMIPYELVFGGIDTSKAVLLCFFNLISKEPDLQRKIRDENEAALKGRDVMFENRTSMPYHQATILELLRYVTPAPLSIPHKTVCNTSLGTQVIPKGTMIWTNLWGLHHREDIWGDPFTFRPERYLDSDGKLVPADHPARSNNMVFGAGFRVCPGETFAMTRLFLIIAYMIQKFEILPKTTGDKQPSCDPRDMKAGLTVKPPPFKVRLRKRLTAT